MAGGNNIYIKTQALATVIEKFRCLAGIEQTQLVKFPPDYRSHLLLDDGIPDYMLLAQTQTDWVTIIVNSSNYLEEFCLALSKELATEIIVIHFQTVSDYYYFSYYNAGSLSREIAHCLSEDFEPVNKGKHFDFEEVGDIYLDYEMMELYSRKLGCNINFNYEAILWTELRKENNRLTVGRFSQMRQKPWWKFW